MTDIYKELKKEADYALNSHSCNLAYQTYGKALMAWELGAINDDEFYAINEKLVKNGLNNPKAALE